MACLCSLLLQIRQSTPLIRQSTPLTRALKPRSYAISISVSIYITHSINITITINRSISISIYNDNLIPNNVTDREEKRLKKEEALIEKIYESKNNP